MNMHLHLLARYARQAVTKAPPSPFTSYRAISCLPQACTRANGIKITIAKLSAGQFISHRAARRQFLPVSDPSVEHDHRSIYSSPDQQKDVPKSFLDRLQDSPPPALYLGFAGLFPFVGPALFCLGSLSYSPFLAFTQVTYGAAILSFLGGIHWGYSIDNKNSPPSWRNLGYSIVPPLIAWGGLLLTSEFGTLLLIAGFAIAWRWDVKVKTTPPWFSALRVCLSVGAILSLGLTYTMGLLYPPPDTNTTYNWVKLMKIVKIILED